MPLALVRSLNFGKVRLMATEKETKQPTREDWIRLAAFIDGEGSILVNERNGDGRTNWGSYLRVVVCNTDPRLPRWLLETFGGTIAVQQRHHPNHRHVIKWHVSCRKAAEVLRGCLAFLLLKREQAEIGLAYQETLKGRGHRVSLSTMLLRKSYRDQLKGLRKTIFPLSDIRRDLTQVEAAVN